LAAMAAIADKAVWDDPRREPTDDQVCLGVVVGSRGLRGDVRVKSFTADPAAVGDYGPVALDGGRRRTLRVVGAAKGVVIVQLEGVDDRDAADALKGMRLMVDRTALPAPDADEYYHADLMGLRAVVAHGAPDGGADIGIVRAVQDYGAGCVLEIDGGACGLVVVPFTRAVVPQVDLALGRIEVVAIPGLLTAAADTEREAV